LYYGEKSSGGTEVHKAGLFGGRLYGIRVLGGGLVSGHRMTAFASPRSPGAHREPGHGQPKRHRYGNRVD
jgi:hypothetical protein